MKIVTAYTKDYEEMYKNLSANKPGYKVIGYRLDDSEDHSRFIKQCHYKLTMIAEQLENSEDDIAWVDADCLIVKPLMYPLNDCDVAVTLRRPAQKDKYYKYSGLLNAGVIFVSNNNNGRRFIKIWKDELPNGEHKTDQEALNLAVGVNENTKYGQFIIKDGIRIKILSCNDYNFFYFPEENTAKILHFKGDVRKYYDEYTKKG